MSVKVSFQKNRKAIIYKDLIYMLQKEVLLGHLIPGELPVVRVDIAIKVDVLAALVVPSEVAEPDVVALNIL